MIPAYNKKRCAAFPFETGIHFRRKSDFFPEEDTTKSYSRFEPEPTRLQAEDHSHQTGWATFNPKLLKQGKSKPWKEILSEFSDKKYTKLDATALVNYFKPLMQWLQRKNKKEYKGWNSTDPMFCPGAIDSDIMLPMEDIIAASPNISTISRTFNYRKIRRITRTAL
ncbi:angiotensin-converting enzyme [Trichonephila clavipes]|nr:angiotensin-converting enzyme [Trichonephila clavipes]